MTSFRILNYDNEISNYKKYRVSYVKVYHILPHSRAWQSANFDFYLRKKPEHFITLIPFQLLKQQLQNNVRMCEGFYTTRPTKFFILFYKFD